MLYQRSSQLFVEASKVIPQMEVDNDYKERYAKILEEYDPENVSETAFTFNGWQF